MSNFGYIDDITTIYQLIDSKKKIIVLYTTSFVSSDINNLFKQYIKNLSNEKEFIFLYYKLNSLTNHNDTKFLINNNKNLYPRLVLYNENYSENIYIDNIDSIELFNQFLIICKNNINKTQIDKLNFLTKYIDAFNHNFYLNLKNRS